MPQRPTTRPAHRRQRAGRLLRLRHDDPGRPGHLGAARAALGAAVTAADAVAGGEAAAYACCRPPGHHATRSSFGGSCYQQRRRGSTRLRVALGETVAVADIDAHHGNGTQEIFYEDLRVLVGSVHVDPGAGWFPHFLGFESEIGAGAGAGANHNLCLAPGSGDRRWLAAITEFAGWVESEGARALWSRSNDAAGADPESPLEVSEGGFRRGRGAGQPRAAHRRRPGGRL